MDRGELAYRILAFVVLAAIAAATAALMGAIALLARKPPASEAE